jgi:hypothetical protein
MFAAFKWSKIRRLAVSLVAEDALTNAQIAERCGVTRRALDKWIAHPDFKAEVARILDETRAALLSNGILTKQNRLDALNDRHGRMRRVIDERATDPSMGAVAGGATGLLVHRERMIGTGRNAQRVDEYEVDTGLLAEMRATEKQAAQELGEWTEKREHSGSLTLIREYGGFDPESV